MLPCRRQLEEITEARRQLEYGIWDVHRQGPEPGAAGDQDLDSDEDIAVANNNALAPNMFCPLTLKEVFSQQLQAESARACCLLAQS